MDLEWSVSHHNLPLTTLFYHTPCRASVEPSTWNLVLKLGVRTYYIAYFDTPLFQDLSTLTSRIIKGTNKTNIFSLIS